MRKYFAMIILLAVTVLMFASCEKVERVIKSVKSSFVGIDRTIVVYSLTGEELKRYKTTSDISPMSCQEDAGCIPRVLFETDKGKRIAIYNATVIAEEN